MSSIQLQVKAPNQNPKAFKKKSHHKQKSFNHEAPRLKVDPPLEQLQQIQQMNSVIGEKLSHRSRKHSPHA